MQILLFAWASFATLVALVLGILHFCNPYPLVQIPDRGHRLYAVPQAWHETIVELLQRSGMSPYGTFNFGVRQTLFTDGFTVIASGEHLQGAAISIPVDDPEGMAKDMCAWLQEKGIQASVFHLDKALEGKLVVLRLPQEFGWEIAYRLTGRKMPHLEWE